jgi:IclR family mhp operon transcriptional activator
MAIDDRLLRVLRILNSHEAITVLDISRQARISRAAVYRITETLCEAGYLRRVPGTTMFKLTWLVKTLSAGYRDASLLEEAGAEAIYWLQEQVRWPTSLATPEKGYMVVRESTRFRSPFVFDTGGVGFKLPMYASAMGLAWFAFAPQQTKEIILEINLRRPDARPPTTAQLHLILEQGWAMRNGGIQPRTASIAVPVFLGGEAVGAISITYGTTVMSQHRAIKHFVPVLKEAASRIAAKSL